MTELNVGQTSHAHHNFKKGENCEWDQGNTALHTPPVSEEKADS